MMGAYLNDIGRSCAGQYPYGSIDPYDGGENPVTPCPSPCGSELRHHVIAEALHLDELIARRGYRAEDHALDAHIAQTLHLIDRNRTAEARRNRELQRLGTILLALVLAQTFDNAIYFFDFLADPVPSVAQARGAFQRRLGMPAEHEWWMRLLHRLGIHLESFDADGLAVIDRIVFRPQLLEQRNVFARAQRAVLEVHPYTLEFLLQPSNADPEDEAAAR